jgi:hypothetical protein
MLERFQPFLEKTIVLPRVCILSLDILFELENTQAISIRNLNFREKNLALMYETRQNSHHQTFCSKT